MQSGTKNAEAQRDREKLLESHFAYQGKRIKLRLDSYDIQGKTKIAELIIHPGAVVMIPIDSKGRLHLVRQWRRGIQQITFELPAGTLEPGEDPLFCAQRELQEEIGFRAEKITALGGFYSAPSFCDEYLHLFLAEDLMPAPLPPDDDEGIDQVVVELSDALRLIQEGKITDAKSIAGILRYAVSKRNH